MLNYAQIYAFCYAKFCGQNSPKKSLFQLWRLRAARCWSWSLRSSSPSKPSSGGWVFCYGLRGLHKARGVGPECYSISICLSIYLAMYIYICVCVYYVYMNIHTYIHVCEYLYLYLYLYASHRRRLRRDCPRSAEDFGFCDAAGYIFDRASLAPSTTLSNPIGKV